jgi:hypothetical protein
MTDMGQQAPAQQPGEPNNEKRAFWRRLKVALGMEPQPSGMPPYIWVERWNAFIIGAMIAVGVPLLGLSGFTVESKKTVLIFWLGTWSVFFTYFEGRELIGQMMGRGAIKQEQLSEQQNTAQNPFYGCVIAVAIWAVVLAVHVTIKLFPVADASIWRLVFVQVPTELWSGFGTTPVRYGVIEWAIILHAWVVTSLINYIMYNTGNTFSKSAPMGERVSVVRTQ